MDKKNLVSLMKAVAKANPSTSTSYSFNGENLSYSAMQETLRNELNNLVGDYYSYQENKNTLFSIIAETFDDVLPAKVQAAYDRFIEVKTFAQGEKPMFKRKLNGSRTRAKQFITRAGLAGRYEVFRLGGEESFEVPTSAIGGAGQIGIEEFMDGRADFSEIVAIIMEGMDELIYHEAGKALINGINELPPANRVSVAGFDEVAFDRLISIASQYGTPTIYCSYDFAVKMIPTRQWMYSDNMKEELWNRGHFTNYKGTSVVILPNGLVDETNSMRTVDPGYCWIIPSGGNDRPIKVAFEGGTMVRERDNDDWSHDIQVYRKVGVVALMTNNICSYIDTTLANNLAMAAYKPADYKYKSII